MNDVTLNIKYKQTPIRLVFYAVFFSLTLFLMLPLSRMFQNYIEPEQMVRSLDVSTPPPPPPTQQEQEKEVTEEELISIEKVDTEIEVEPLNVTLDASLLGELFIKIDVGNFNVKQGQSDIMAEVKMFTLSELDQTPMSVNDPLFRTPPDLDARGEEEIVAEALIVLTETGDVKFIQFVSLSHQGANEVMREYIEKLKYTAPTKDGEAGRVRFRLPIRIPIESFSDNSNQRNRQNNSAKQNN